MRHLRIGVSTLLMIGSLAEVTSSGAASVVASIRSADEKRDELSEFFACYLAETRRRRGFTSNQFPCSLKQVAVPSCVG